MTRNEALSGMFAVLLGLLVPLEAVGSEEDGPRNDHREAYGARCQSSS